MATQTKDKKKPVSTLAEFIKAIRIILDQWTQQTQFNPWFRGQGDESWSLIPSVYRPPHRENLQEDDFRDDFRRRAWPYLATAAREPSDEWEWYFIMQHYGLPTRLLDWSESALVALYFALRDSPPKSNPAVWILDPWALNKKIARKGDCILSPSERRISAYLPEPFSATSIPGPPIALEPPLKSLRIAAQKGVFTLHGTSVKPLEGFADLRPFLSKIVIEEKSKVKLKDELAVAGITETSVFPELPALCKELLEYWSA